MNFVVKGRKAIFREREMVSRDSFEIGGETSLCLCCDGKEPEESDTLRRKAKDGLGVRVREIWKLEGVSLRQV